MLFLLALLLPHYHYHLSCSIKLAGKWDDHLNALWLEDTEDYPKNHKLQLWKMFNENYSENAYRMTKYAMTFNCMLLLLLLLLLLLSLLLLFVCLFVFWFLFVS
jgi:hypothetical protein